MLNNDCYVLDEYYSSDTGSVPRKKKSVLVLMPVLKNIYLDFGLIPILKTK